MPISPVFPQRAAIAAWIVLALWAPNAFAEAASTTATPNAAESSSESSHEHWEFETRDDAGNWSLYTATVPGSDHLRYRLVSQSPEPVERVAQALALKLSDLRYMQDGFDRTILSRGDDFMINYVRMDVPIVSDRDVVLETRWWTAPETSTYHVSWAPLGGEVPPVP